MTLSRRQTNSIAGILNSDQELLREASRLRQKMLSNSMRNERLTENKNPDGFEKEVEAVIAEGTTDEALKFLETFDKMLYKELAQLLPMYGADKTTAKTLMDDLEDFDPDGLQEIQQEFVSDVLAAMRNYASQAALLTSHAKLAGMESELPPGGPRGR